MAPNIQLNTDTPMATNSILVVDDDIAICRTLQLHLSSQGYQITTAHSVEEGLKAAREKQPNLIILDICMPGMSGLDGLLEFKKEFPNIHPIMITAFHDMDSTIQAMQRGAEDYIHKPIDIDELDATVARILSPEQLDTVQAETRPVSSTGNEKNMVGRSHAMKEIFKTIGLVAARPVTVLITGESGTGKELVASAIHRANSNASGPFVAVNCAALVETLLESDMFGHEKGAFTGAVAKQPGKFALAKDGTIFLDEIGELSPPMQAKLLRVLQEKEFTPVGGKHSERTDARVVAATNVNLEEKVRNGEFREDLFYRLRVVTIHLPPLRERKEDMMDLVQTLLGRINKQLSRNVNQVSMDVFTCMQEYNWPGNVRELENVLAKAVALCPGEVITRDLIGDVGHAQPKEISQNNTIEQLPLSQWSLEEMTKAHIQRVLEVTNWHKGQACDILGISRPRLRRMINQFGLQAPEGIVDDDHEHDE